MKKHVERASHDPKLVITTYEGQHVHDFPTSRPISQISVAPDAGTAGIREDSRTESGEMKHIRVSKTEAGETKHVKESKAESGENKHVGESKTESDGNKHVEESKPELVGNKHVGESISESGENKHVGLDMAVHIGAN